MTDPEMQGQSRHFSGYSLVLRGPVTFGYMYAHRSLHLVINMLSPIKLSALFSAWVFSGLAACPRLMRLHCTPAGLNQVEGREVRGGRFLLYI